MKTDHKEVDHKEIAKTLLENRRKFTVESYVELATAITAAGGQMVHASFDDDDWCGTGRLPWPPRGIEPILEVIAKLGGGGRFIINGSPYPIELDIVVARDRIR